MDADGLGGGVVGARDSQLQVTALKELGRDTLTGKLRAPIVDGGHVSVLLACA